MEGYSLKSYILKQTVVNEAGSLIELNITYPQLTDFRNRYLEKRFNDYYSAIADGLKHFANHRLAILAAKARLLQGSDYIKWAMVGKYTCVTSAQSIEINFRIWIYKDGARKEKILNAVWTLSEETPMLQRMINKALTNSQQA